LKQLRLHKSWKRIEFQIIQYLFQHFIENIRIAMTSADSFF